jgi:Flp pilus assembly protein TadB
MGMIERPNRPQFSLILSAAFAVVLGVYFARLGRPLEGVALAVVVVMVGYLEYRRTRHHRRTAQRFEIKAESKR